MSYLLEALFYMLIGTLTGYIFWWSLEKVESGRQRRKY